jgi:hypothetical protein
MQIGALGHQNGCIAYAQICIFPSDLCGRLMGWILAQFNETQLDIIHAERLFALAGQIIKEAHRAGGTFTAGARALNTKMRATAGDADITRLLNLMQVLIKRAAQAGKQVVIHRL